MKTLMIGIVMLSSSVAAGAVQTAALPDHLARMDASGDGKLSLAEFTSDRAKVLRMLDANRDGKVSKDEATAYYVKIAPAEDPKTIKRIADVTTADKNGDGTTLAEMEAVRAEGFRTRDKNGDGFITADEV